MAEDNGSLTVLSKQDLIDVGNVMLCQYMYYAQHKRINEISKMLSVPQVVVTKYLSVDIPKDERLDQIVSYISVKCLSLMTPLEEIVGRLASEIKEWGRCDEYTDPKSVISRAHVVKSYGTVLKAYTALLETLRRVHDVGEKTAGSSFVLNILDQSNTTIQ